MGTVIATTAILRHCIWTSSARDRLVHQINCLTKDTKIWEEKGGEHTFLAWQRSRTDEHRGRRTARLIPDIVPWTQGVRLIYVNTSTFVLTSLEYASCHCSKTYSARRLLTTRTSSPILFVGRSVNTSKSTIQSSTQTPSFNTLETLTSFIRVVLFSKNVVISQDIAETNTVKQQA